MLPNLRNNVCYYRLINMLASFNSFVFPLKRSLLVKNHPDEKRCMNKRNRKHGQIAYLNEHTAILFKGGTYNENNRSDQFTSKLDRLISTRYAYVVAWLLKQRRLIHQTFCRLLASSQSRQHRAHTIIYHDVARNQSNRFRSLPHKPKLPPTPWHAGKKELRICNLSGTWRTRSLLEFILGKCIPNSGVLNTTPIFRPYTVSWSWSANNPFCSTRAYDYITIQTTAYISTRRPMNSSVFTIGIDQSCGSTTALSKRPNSTGFCPLGPSTT